MKKYQVRIYNQSDNSYRLVMETPDHPTAMDKMIRLESQGHKVLITQKNYIPKHLSRLSETSINNLRHLFRNTNFNKEQD